MSAWGKPVSYAQRVKAAEIVRQLRKQDNAKVVAHKLGLSLVYISTAERLNKRINQRTRERSNWFFCPRHAIRKILAFAERNHG